MKGSSGTETIGFLLLPEYTIYGLIPAIEALRLANQNSGRSLYGWRILSIDGAPVRASSGMMLTPEAGITEVPSLPILIVCAGNRPTQYITRSLLTWLRRLAQGGSSLGAIDTGAFTLAAAGLLDGYRVTLHWEAIPLFREQFPEIDVVEQLFVIDRDRLTCAGGVAALDMMLQLIYLRHGYALAQVVANGFVHERIRGAGERQRRAPEEPGGTGRDALLSLIQSMEENLEAPLSRAELARAYGLSVRQLERVMRRRLNETPMSYYLKLRLLAARNLLFYSDLRIQEIASACGFSSPQFFARSFRRQYRQSPREFRSVYSGERLHRFHPQVSQLMRLELAQGRQGSPNAFLALPARPGAGILRAPGASEVQATTAIGRRLIREEGPVRTGRADGTGVGRGQREPAGDAEKPAGPRRHGSGLPPVSGHSR